MAGYDKNLDKEVFGENLEFERSVIRVSIYTYNEGTPKLQISRQNKNAEGELSFAKLGRLTKEEAEKVLPVMQKALQQM